MNEQGTALATQIEEFKKLREEADELFKTTLPRLQDVLNEKMNQDQYRRIMDEFTRYAAYDDLRDLYKRFIPEISKFEDKLKQVRDEIAQFHAIIGVFDGSLLERATKKQMSEF